MVKRSYLIIILLFVFISCGGSGGSNGSSTPTPEPETKNVSQGIIELGKVENGEVQIETLDGYVLLNIENTNSQGEIKIDIKALKLAVNNYNSSLKLVKIISYGGIDTDPNDDGTVVENEKKEIYSNVEAILPLEFIYNTNGYHISFLTTFVSKLLQETETENIDKEYLDFLVKELDMHDVNKDGKIDIKDIVYYDMVQNNSALEAELREKYLQTFHSSKSSSAEEDKILEDYKKYLSLAKVKVQFTNNQFNVKIIKSNKNNNIFYGISTNALDPKSLEIYNNNELTINNNSRLVYQECLSNEGNTQEECYRSERIYFVNNQYHYNAIPETIQDDNFLDLIDTIKNRDKRIKELENEISQAQD